VTAPVEESAADVQPGGIFVARPGRSVDGHDFIPQAIERGAAAVVGERDISGLRVPYVRVRNAQEAVGDLAAAYHDYPSRRLVVIGVTGTDGKTTTSTLIHSILQVATENKAGLISTVSAVIGDQNFDTGLHVTTPGAPQIQALLARMVDNGLTHVVLEMTSHGLAQGRLNGVDIDIAVLTNLTHEHLDYHGSFEAYRAAKGRMFAMLGQSFRKPGRDKIGVINADDPHAAYFSAFPMDEMRLFSITKHPEHYCWTVDVDYQPGATVIQVGAKGENLFRTYQTHLSGHFNVMNVLAAVAATRGQDAHTKAMQEGVRRVTSIPGRMERIDEGQPYLAIVDFAHTPNALKNALTACRHMLQPGKRLIAVIGSAGLRDREKRRLMPEVAADLADFTFLTAEDPRTESLDDILQVMADATVAAGGVEGQTFARVPDRGEALHHACQMAQPGDIVIACGKGHEQSMAFGTVEYPWDDRDALRTAIRGTPLRTLPTANEP
jgi:UDP-N-acetylmuramoyl-L-alanyl-D-glutamate--2,6-diaminopimelate ligase